ncbi:MAG: DUF4406 domain-containing protein, partial [Lachnospiraceae bacterium]|nr:DUF4406 domain-containing protein [Lachnospiraceae bacterium]
MRLYISGPVREVENYEERFLDAERVLENKGHIVFNPVKICASMPDDMVYEEYMSVDLKILSLCDGVVLLPGWQSSIGANREYGFALGADLEIFSSPDQVPSVSLRAAMLYMTDVREQNHDVTTCASAKPADVRDDSEKASVADGCEEEQETNTQKGDVVELKKKKQKR